MADTPENNNPQKSAGTGDPEALAGAIRLHQDGRMDEAINAYQTLLETHPEDAGALSALGVALRTQGCNEEALEVLVRSAGLHPDDAELAYYLGNARRDAGDSDTAIAGYR